MLLKAVTENSHLFEVLREFGMMSKEFTVTDPSAKGMLDKVVQQMERWGYLVLQAWYWHLHFIDLNMGSGNGELVCTSTRID